MITDEPSFYTHLSSKLTVIEVDARQLDEWKGPHHFLWRIKIKALASICDKYPGEAVVYLDTDTFLYRNAGDIQTMLKNGHALMHEREGALSEASSKTEKRMWAQVKNKLFATIKITERHAMWNAGVVATPNTKNNADMHLALQICDDMCAATVTPRLIEQFALSVALQTEYGLLPASESIAHYWSNKEEWHTAISNFFMKSYLYNYSPKQTVDAIKDFNFSAIPVVKKTTNTHRRLKKKIDSIFPARDLLFVNNYLKHLSGVTNK